MERGGEKKCIEKTAPRAADLVPASRRGEGAGRVELGRATG